MFLVTKSLVGAKSLALISLVASGLFAGTAAVPPRSAVIETDLLELIDVGFETPVADPDVLLEDEALLGVAREVEAFALRSLWGPDGVEELELFLATLYPIVEVQAGDDFIYAWRIVLGQLRRVCYPKDQILVDGPSFSEPVVISFRTPTYFR